MILKTVMASKKIKLYLKQLSRLNICILFKGKYLMLLLTLHKEDLHMEWVLKCMKAAIKYIIINVLLIIGLV